MKKLFVAPIILVCLFFYPSSVDPLSGQDLPPDSSQIEFSDIDNFWHAFDQLKNCKSRFDSIQTIQKEYLNKASTGLLDFIDARDFTAEGFINAINTFPKFYRSVRKNTLKVKKEIKFLHKVVNNLKKIYPNYKPKKICFAIGMVNTGGTISSNYLLIGSELATSNHHTDLSEFGLNPITKILGTSDTVKERIQKMVAHEYIHTQQPPRMNRNSTECVLLFEILQEGMCDFIGQLISGGHINQPLHEYGNRYEETLWQDLKSEMCNSSTKNWLYNTHKLKGGTPADLGYYVGYKIVESYYNRSKNKSQALVDIIEMDDPIQFLLHSKYDLKFRKK